MEESLPKRVKILYVINGLTIGGAEKLLLSLVEKLNKDKYKIIVCSLYCYNPLHSDFEKIGVTVKCLHMKNSWDAFGLLRLIKLLKQEKVDIVHTHLFYSNIYGRIAARLVHIPIIISTEHSNDPWRSKPGLKFRTRLQVDRITSRFCHVIIAVSQSVKDYLVKWSHIDPNKVLVIHNGIEINKYKIINKKKNEINKKYIVGCIGRLEPMKGHVYFIKAAAKILEKVKNVHFILVGDGSLRNDLEKQADVLKIAEKISFTGLRDDVPELLTIMDVFVLPSLWEGFGIVLLEAMAMGKAVVASDTGGVSEVIIDKITGYLCPPMDAEALANAIVGLLKNPTNIKKIGSMGRSRVNQYFTLDQMVRKTEHVYDALITDKLVR